MITADKAFSHVGHVIGQPVRGGGQRPHGLIKGQQAVYLALKVGFDAGQRIEQGDLKAGDRDHATILVIIIQNIFGKAQKDHSLTL